MPLGCPSIIVTSIVTRNVAFRSKHAVLALVMDVGSWTEGQICKHLGRESARPTKKSLSFIEPMINAN